MSKKKGPAYFKEKMNGPIELEVPIRCCQCPFYTLWPIKSLLGEITGTPGCSLLHSEQYEGNQWFQLNKVGASERRRDDCPIDRYMVDGVATVTFRTSRFEESIRGCIDGLNELRSYTKR